MANVDSSLGAMHRARSKVARSGMIRTLVVDDDFMVAEVGRRLCARHRASSTVARAGWMRWMGAGDGFMVAGVAGGVGARGGGFGVRGAAQCGRVARRAVEGLKPGLVSLGTLRSDRP